MPCLFGTVSRYHTTLSAFVWTDFSQRARFHSAGRPGRKRTS